MSLPARRVIPAFALLAAALNAVACTAVVPPRATMGPAAPDPHAAWARVLRDFVLNDGSIDFIGLRRDPRDLETYVAWVATHGPGSAPELFPTRETRIAYAINAYNALAMHHVVASPRRPAQQLRFFLLSTFEIDGQRRSLYGYETDVVRPLGEPRVHFALNCMVRGCPRLPREPFEAARLDAQLERETRRFLNEPSNVQVDPPLRTVRLSAILKFYTADFLAQSPTLIDYVNRYRDERVPDDHRVQFIPYDWTLRQR